MIAGYWGRPTIDITLGLNAFLKSGDLKALQAFLNLVLINRKDSDRPKFPEKIEDAIRFFLVTEDDPKPLSWNEAIPLLGSSLKIVAPVLECLESPEKHEEFLKSNAHYTLIHRLVVFGKTNLEPGHLLYMREGHRGSKHARTWKEILPFLEGQPNLKMLLIHVGMDAELPTTLTDLESLKSFIDQNPEKNFEMFMDTFRMICRAFFEKPSSDFSEKENWAVEPNPDSRATFNLFLKPVPKDSIPLQFSMEEAKADLEKALIGVLEFISETGVNRNFLGGYGELLEKLQSNNLGKTTDLWPHLGLSKEAGSLYHFAWRADAFGQMGSWNDNGLDHDDPDTELYTRWSNTLVLAILKCLCASANAEPSR